MTGLRPFLCVTIELPTFYDVALTAYGLHPVARCHEPFGNQPYRLTVAEWDALNTWAAERGDDALSDDIERGLYAACDDVPLFPELGASSSE